ncbi:MAG TPA: class I SAM-dependent RNA methyltransferase [Opitutaceae bacterium]|nr:class I SAM-dependent RNA methyltransferase [Opitutaceae bacterium]
MVKPKKFNDRPFPYHHELELTVESLTNLGAGVARVELGDPGTKWVVFIPFALPGERVRARIFRNHANYSEADLVEVLDPSPQRIAPRCPLFGTCGGCQYQNLAYPAQLEWKRRHVAELLQRLARIDAPVSPVVPSPREFGYRSKLTPHFSAPARGKINPAAPGNAQGTVEPGPLAVGEGRAANPAGMPPIGFLRAGSRFNLVDVPQCPIATPGINAALENVRAEVHARMLRGEYSLGATILLREAREGVITDPGAEITEEVEGIVLRFLGRDFFQNNPSILPAFTRHVREQASAGGARFLVDAYCGSGLFALTAARAFEAVAGVELSPTAVDRARTNASANGIANARFIAGDAAAIFAGLEFAPGETAVVIDPPRKGCDAPFLQQLLEFRPARIVYVSCDPATQMRDLSMLVPGGYAIETVQPFDLFPQTRHLECVITLARTTIGQLAIA